MQSQGALRAAEFRRLLDEVLQEVDGDERAGAILKGAGLRMRFHFPDVGLFLEVAASGDPDRYLEWSFEEDPDFGPKLELEMNSDVANGYLQGKESLAIAIARGKVRARGSSRTTLAYLPAVRLLVEPYRRVITTEHPTLLV